MDDDMSETRFDIDIKRSCLESFLASAVSPYSERFT